LIRLILLAVAFALGACAQKVETEVTAFHSLQQAPSGKTLPLDRLLNIFASITTNCVAPGDSSSPDRVGG